MDSDMVHKVTLVALPARFGDARLPSSFELGTGFRIVDRSELLAKLDLEIFKKHVANETLRQITGASYCLEHGFPDEPIHGGLEMESLALMKYIAAHLRLIVPNQIDVNDYIRGIIRDNALDSFGFGKSDSNVQ